MIIKNKKIRKKLGYIKHRIKRKKLKRYDFTIISNNCFGRKFL